MTVRPDDFLALERMSMDNETMTDGGELAVVDGVDWLARARDAWAASAGYFDTNIRADVEAALRQFDSQHPSGSKYYAEAYRGRARGFRPKTRACVTKYEATAAEALFSSYDVVDVQALDRDDKAQVEAAAFAKQLLQIRLTTSIPWFMLAMGAFQDALVTGVAVSKQSWVFDASKVLDRPDIELVPTENFRFDPSASWIDPVGSSPYLIHVIPMYIKDIKARINSGAWLPVPEGDLMTGACRAWDTIRGARSRDRTEPTDSEIAVTDYSVVWVHENIMEEDGEDVLFYTLGAEKLLSRPVPLRKQYPQGRPFVVGVSVVEAHKTYPSGLPRLTRDVQAEANELSNLRRDNVNFVLNKRYFVKRGKQVDLRSLTRNIPGSAVLMDDPQSDVVAHAVPDVTASGYQEQDRLNLDFDEVAGIFSGSSVQANRRLNETVGGMNILTSGADKVTGYRLRTFVETWVEPVLRQLLKLEQEYETDANLMGRAAKLARLSVNMEPPQAFDAMLAQDVLLNVNVGMSATNPTDKINMLLLAMRSIKEVLADGVLMRYGMDAGEIIKEIFAGIGYRDGSRFFADTENPQVQALQAQVQELQQALDAKYPQALLQAQIAKLTAETEKTLAAKVQTLVQSSYAAMQGGQVIAAVPGVAPIADEIMRGAGYQVQAGQDPDFPQPGAALPGVAQGDIRNRRTGIEYNPATQAMPTDAPDVAAAVPETGNVGQTAGIETLAADGVQQ